MSMDKQIKIENSIDGTILTGLVGDVIANEISQKELMVTRPVIGLGKRAFVNYHFNSDVIVEIFSETVLNQCPKSTETGYTEEDITINHGVNVFVTEKRVGSPHKKIIGQYYPFDQFIKQYVGDKNNEVKLTNYMEELDEASKVSEEFLRDINEMWAERTQDKLYIVRLH